MHLAVDVNHVLRFLRQCASLTMYIAHCHTPQLIFISSKPAVIVALYRINYAACYESYF